MAIVVIVVINVVDVEDDAKVEFAAVCENA